MNRLKTAVLMTVLTVILVLIGEWIGGISGMLWFLLLGVVMNGVSYFFSDRIALAMAHAQPVSEQEAPQLYAIVRDLCERANLPMPRIYITPDPQPNAFATGRNPNHAAVACTQGILQMLEPWELEGVLAHEISHVRNRDILISSIAAVLAGAITSIARILQFGWLFGGNDDERDNPLALVGQLMMIILAPIAAALVQLSISRSREFAADASGAKLLGTGEPLARALEKIDSAAQRVPSYSASPSTAHLYIVNPLKARDWTTLFSTHPPTAERIRRLLAMHF